VAKNGLKLDMLVRVGL